MFAMLACPQTACVANHIVAEVPCVGSRALKPCIGAVHNLRLTSSAEMWFVRGTLSVSHNKEYSNSILRSILGSF